MEEIILNKFIEWIREDVPYWDETTEILIPEDTIVEAAVISKEDGVAACIEDVEKVLKKLDINVVVYKRDGERVSKGDIVLWMKGSGRRILLIERTLLNLLGHCFGIASLTRMVVEKVRMKNPRVRVAATRKTLPGLRYFEKKAVLIGGGDAHRMSLSDMILIKDNHIKIVGGVRKAVEIARLKAGFTRKIEVEVSNIDELIEAVEAGADIVMLDNFKPEDVGEAIRLLKERGLRDRVLIEVSGGIGLDNIDKYLNYDIDIISMGMITKSARSHDLSLEVLKVYSS